MNLWQGQVLSWGAQHVTDWQLAVAEEVANGPGKKVVGLLCRASRHATRRPHCLLLWEVPSKRDGVQHGTVCAIKMPRHAGMQSRHACHPDRPFSLVPDAAARMQAWSLTS